MPTFLVVLWSGDARECAFDGRQYIHVLNSAWRVTPGDRRIKEIQRVVPVNGG